MGGQGLDCEQISHKGLPLSDPFSSSCVHKSWQMKNFLNDTQYTPTKARQLGKKGQQQHSTSKPKPDSVFLGKITKTSSKEFKEHSMGALVQNNH